MKLSNMIMILIILQMSIILFDSVIEDPDYELTAYASNDTAIWDFVLDPTKWTGSSLLLIFGALTAVGGTIGVGVYLVTKSDTALFFGVFTLLLGAGAIPIASLYNVVTRDPIVFGCTGMPCTPAIIVWALTGGILAIFYVLSVLEWWSNRRV